MKVLLDENLPHKLRHSLVNHDVRTVDYMGWSGTRNGELLRLCDGEGFDVLVTGDQSLSYQQNTSKLHLAVVVLDTIDLNTLLKMAGRITDAISSVTAGAVLLVRSR